MTAEELANKAIAVLRQRIPSNTCPRCGQAKWNAELVGTLVTRVPVPNPFPLPPAFHPALLLICVNCGFMSHHHLKYLGVSEEELRNFGVILNPPTGDKA